MDWVELSSSFLLSGSLPHELLDEAQEDGDDDGGLERLAENDEENGDREQVARHASSRELQCSPTSQMSRSSRALCGRECQEQAVLGGGQPWGGICTVQVVDASAFCTESHQIILILSDTGTPRDRNARVDDSCLIRYR